MKTGIWTRRMKIRSLIARNNLLIFRNYCLIGFLKVRYFVLCCRIVIITLVRRLSKNR